MLMHSSEPTLGEVFIANRAQLQRVAQKIVRTADLADEVLQDAYLKLADGAAVRDVRKPLGYCCQVVRNVAFDYHRHQSVEASYRTYCEDVELVSPPSNDAPERVLDGRQALAVIDRVLGALPARTRLAFELNRLSGMTQREIAARLGCSATLVNFMIKDADAALESCRYLVQGN
ncbi:MULTISPECIES: sigma-70 family RNA polymerase sigma factor [Variovorax]|jgi:RNA polymerase sigma-70 factor (ECF subfamily)|nr:MULTISPECIES: sigma-70 family RNA polymerase sigma factor [unclassified Variovorax]MBS77366.1 RNA polymerase subunit sigma-70 [Variovorax sp.]QRF56227.1 sigma-70 family RNA polymerase sigma factor [Variovorax paradoxus]TAJ65227.1 MAG: sigma-70 family RNA polymerase sigma factor [Variovorax sp.]SFO04940.1 RNA polymerase sigma-70 factor, ECF subfamily [Variovorax sp. PDC80]